MSRVGLLFFVISIVPAAGFGQAADNAGTAGVAKEVFATIAKWGEAVRGRNTQLLDEIFEDNVIITTFDGKTRGKLGELELFKPDPNIRTLRVKNEDVKVRVFGNTAIATGECRLSYVRDQKLMNTTFRFTASFVKDKARWQVVALHTSQPSQSGGGRAL
jgi:ketosteroid isomerase-like protein